MLQVWLFQHFLLEIAPNARKTGGIFKIVRGGACLGPSSHVFLPSALAVPCHCTIFVLHSLAGLWLWQLTFVNSYKEIWYLKVCVVAFFFLQWVQRWQWQMKRRMQRKISCVLQVRFLIERNRVGYILCPVLAARAVLSSYYWKKGLIHTTQILSGTHCVTYQRQNLFFGCTFHSPVHV